MISYRMISYDIIWIWYHMIAYDIIWYDVTCHDVTWRDMIWYDMKWYWYDFGMILVWYWYDIGMICMAWRGVAWRGMACFYLERIASWVGAWFRIHDSVILQTPFATHSLSGGRSALLTVRPWPKRQQRRGTSRWTVPRTTHYSAPIWARRLVWTLRDPL